MEREKEKKKKLKLEREKEKEKKKKLKLEREKERKGAPQLPMDTDLSALRAKRLAEMKQQHEKPSASPSMPVQPEDQQKQQ